MFCIILHVLYHFFINETYATTSKHNNNSNNTTTAQQHDIDIVTTQQRQRNNTTTTTPGTATRTRCGTSSSTPYTFASPSTPTTTPEWRWRHHTSTVTLAPMRFPFLSPFPPTSPSTHPPPRTTQLLLQLPPAALTGAPANSTLIQFCPPSKSLNVSSMDPLCDVCQHPIHHLVSSLSCIVVALVVSLSL